MTTRTKLVDLDWLESNFPCMQACPVHTQAGRYVSLIAEGRYEEAYRYARMPNLCLDLRPRLRSSLRTRLPPRRIRPAHFHPRSEAIRHGAPRARIAESDRRFLGNKSVPATPKKWRSLVPGRRECRRRTILPCSVIP